MVCRRTCRRSRRVWRRHEGRRHLFDRAEVVVQVFDTPDPVGGAKADFAADAGNPAEMISRYRRVTEMGCRGSALLVRCRRG
jgi:hypothetical protein